MIDTDKYEGHIQGEWRDTRHEGALAHHIVAYNPQISYANDAGDVKICTVEPNEATANLVTDAPLLLEFIQKIVEEWSKPNQCNQAFGKDVRWLMYEYGLITFNEETRRYEVIE